MSTANLHYLVEAEGNALKPLTQSELFCFDFFCDSLWCPLDAIPGPEVDESEGTMRNCHHARFASAFIFLIRSPFRRHSPHPLTYP